MLRNEVDEAQARAMEAEKRLAEANQKIEEQERTIAGLNNKVSDVCLHCASGMWKRVDLLPHPGYG
jgi:uncharacterized coiled-coil protein SlyX